MADQQSVAGKPSRSKRDNRRKPGTGTNGREDPVASYEKELAGYLQKRIKPGLNSGAIPLLARSIAKEIAHREAPTGGSPDGEADEQSKGESDEKPESKADEQTEAKADEQTEASEDEESKGEADEQSDDEPEAGSDDEPSSESESDEEPSAQSDEDEASGESDEDESGESDQAPDFEAEMHDLQAELGEHWILRFSVQGDAAWLTAEMDDGSQRIEAPTADVLADAVSLLNQSGGRSD